MSHPNVVQCYSWTVLTGADRVHGEPGGRGQNRCSVSARRGSPGRHRPWLRRRVRPRSAPPRRAPRWSTARQRLPTRPSAAWQRWQSRVGRVCREGRGGGREGDKGTISGHVRATFAGLRSFAQRPFNASCPHLRFSATPRTRLTCHVTNSSASFPPLSPSQARHRGGPRPRRRAGRRGAGARCRGGRERPRRGQRGD